jgi:hypothetical protein
MGTRCLTVFVDGESELAVLYRQMDGYPEGHGRDLAHFLAEAVVVNGISGPGRQFNGIGDLAVRTIAALKERLGGPEREGSLYLYPAKTRDCGEEYVYYVTATVQGGITIQAFEAEIDGTQGAPLFTGPPDAMLAWILRPKAAR